jgi:hypothetical protein
VKSIVFVLLMHAHAGTTEPAAVFESLEQCRAAQARASENVAADYTCDAVTVDGTWSRKARFIAARGSN